MILTIACLRPDEYIVIEDDGFIDQYRGIALRPASSRAGNITFGPGRYEDAMRFITNRNRVKDLKENQ